MIQACAERSTSVPKGIFKGSIQGLLQSFGLPRWVTGRHPKAQSETAIRRVEDSIVRRVPIVDRKQVHVVAPYLTKRETAVLAQVQVAELSKPTPKSTKDLIIAWFETPEKSSASFKTICAAFPEIAPGGLSSRLSELVKAGLLISAGKGTGIYSLPA